MRRKTREKINIRKKEERLGNHREAGKRKRERNEIIKQRKER